jgi:C-5 cytosine-specific DNA methylase
MDKPLAIDLFCGLGGWTEGLLSEGYHVVGFDIERHVYGPSRYPAQLVLQDVTTLHGAQFKGAALIVASPPCQEYSYMAMPWSRAKKIAAEYRAGVRDVADLTRLFDACFRIRREASEAAGHHIPLVVENVRGAIPWVGRSRWNFGSFHLWGDVPALMPIPIKRATKVGGISFSGYGEPGYKAQAFTGTAAKRLREETVGETGIKQGGDWFNDSQPPSISRQCGSKSNARKAASAHIAKIPFVLSSYIAKVYKP